MQANTVSIELDKRDYGYWEHDKTSKIHSFYSSFVNDEGDKNYVIVIAGLMITFDSFNEYRNFLASLAVSEKEAQEVEAREMLEAMSI